MGRFVAGGLALLSAVLIADAPRARPGQKAPLPVGGRQSPGRGNILLVFGAFGSSRGCSTDIADFVRTRENFRKLGVDIVAVSPYPEAQLHDLCPELADRVSVLYDAEQEYARAYGTHGKRTGVLLDENGIVRRVVTPQSAVSATLLGEVSAWTAGKAVYDSQCARCHGVDGRDTTYPDIKSLAGIGTRITEPQILERTALTGAVDMSGWTDSQRHALAAYVAGL